MELKTYLDLNTKKKRILVTKDVARTNSLIRSIEKKSGKSVANVACISYRNIAETLYLFYESQHGYTPSHTLLEDAQAGLLFRSVLLGTASSLSYFKNKDMLTVATCAEIFSKLNLVRSCGWSGREDSGNMRVKDLKTLVEKYEARLKAEKKLDYIALLKVLSVTLQEGDLNKDLQRCFDAEISYIKEEEERFSGLEKELLKLLSAQPLSVWEKEPGREVLEEKKLYMQFFRGYGFFNEANYVVNDILAGGIPLGDVTIFYTSENQRKALESAFGGSDLPIAFTSDKSLADNKYIALARRILAWAKDGFSEKTLAEIYDSPALRNEYTDSDGTVRNAAGGEAYFRHVLSARERRKEGFTLGWGYQRNLEFTAQERKLSPDVRTEKALEIHEALLDIFGASGNLYDESNPVCPAEIYNKLTEFLWRFDNKCVDDIKQGRGALTQLKDTIAYEEQKYPLEQCIAYIDELLVSLTGEEEQGSDGAKAVRLSDWKHTGRNHLYVIGLSLKETQESTMQSPVLLDEEMEDWLEEGYKPTIRNRVALRHRNEYRTLSLFEGKKLTLGYSDYDTVQFLENGPSGLYLDALKACGKKLGDAIEFVYGNPTAGSTASPAGSFGRGNCPVEPKTSNSTIEKLLDCPKKYCYSVVERLPENKYTELNPGEWLDHLHYGTLFHSIAQEYVEKKFIKEAGTAYDADVDPAELENIINCQADLLAKVYPIPSFKQKDLEVKELTEVCRKFFEQYHKEMTTEDFGWRVLMTEKRFEDQKLLLTDYSGSVTEFAFNGIIDRIDYKVDHAAKRISFRIADYKTGKRVNKEKAVKIGTVIQHWIYRQALMGQLLSEILEAAAGLEKNPAVKNYQTEYVSFTYSFPTEEKDRNYVIPGGEAEIGLTRLKAELTAIAEMKGYPDHIQLYDKILEYTAKYVSIDPELGTLIDAMTNKYGKMTAEETKSCGHCDYKDLCPAARGGKVK